MSYIFISYSKKNHDYARRLADYLRDHGFDVWIDDRIEYGDDWEQTIFDRIKNCTAFIVVMSPDSYASKWVQRECHFAEKHNKPTFPILYMGDEFPRYGLTQYVDAIGGKLPPDSFLDRLAKFIPRGDARGSAVVAGKPEHSEGDQHLTLQKTTDEPITNFFTLSVNGRLPEHVLIIDRPEGSKENPISSPGRAKDTSSALESMIVQLRDEVITVGRRESNTIVIKSPLLSSNHFMVIRTPLGYAVEDTGSANGTFLNGNRLTSRQLLASGDVIRAGPMWFHYQIRSDISALDPEYDALLRQLIIPNSSPSDRAAVGLQLAACGDWRYGVGLGTDGSPTIDWVTVPEGSFRYQTSDSVRLPTFAISRYPVTFAQFGAFLADNGYVEKSWWDENEWNWKDLRKHPEFWNDLEVNISNHPVVGVSFYEARAFCRWLSAKRGHEIRLPTEQEWEKAARGPQGLLYPWGNQYHSGYANLNETLNQMGDVHIGHATAVGIFREGVSAYGILDMIGNIYEWCSGADESASAVLRGGAWISAVDATNTTTRRVVNPKESEIFAGFRIAATIPFDP